MAAQVTAVFDGQCVICRGTRAFVRAFDWFGRVTFMDLHDRAAVRARFPDLDHDAAMGEIHVYDRVGRVYPGFLGTRRMFKEMPLTFPLWLILQFPGMTWVGARVYRWIARRRYAVNRLFGVELAPCDDVCKV
jgi:predicted DCC family thiol-disulfide oxidoreductase YuxK